MEIINRGLFVPQSISLAYQLLLDDSDDCEVGESSPMLLMLLLLLLLPLLLLFIPLE
jgi:hypothetical protein